MAAIPFDLVDNLKVNPQVRNAFEQGAAFGWTSYFRAADTDGSVAGDWYVAMQVRRVPADRDGGDPLLDLDSDVIGGITLSIVPDAELGDKVKIDVAVTGTQTGAMPIGKWYYDMRLVRLSDGYPRRLAEGRAQVKGAVTR